MKDFGVEAENEDYKRLFVRAGQRYAGREIGIEGDFSNAAYFFAAAAICKGKIKVTNLSSDSKQGDKFFLEALARMGCKVKWGEGFVEVEGEKLSGIGEIDMNDYPDIVMPLCIAAAFAEGKTRITNIAHLKFKESDRLAVTVKELQKLGADVSCDDSSITVNGTANGAGLHGAEIESHNDHRIAMSFAVAGLRVKGVSIANEDAVNKSFPGFFEEIEKIVKR
jgi:3-phosphoshikimate 1-carboxyvinyltransferase